MQENPNTNVPMIRMSDVVLTEVEWLWYPYLPLGKITILQGNPGEGKTYFGMELAVRGCRPGSGTGHQRRGFAPHALR